MLAEPPNRLWESLKKSVPEHLVKNWSQLAAELLDEIAKEYRMAVKKSTGEVDLINHLLGFFRFKLNKL